MIQKDTFDILFLFSLSIHLFLDPLTNLSISNQQMKKILINDTVTVLLPMFLLLYFLCSACSEKKRQEKEYNVYASRINFNDSIHNFGTFSSDSAVQRHVFTFVNKGNVPAVILNIDPSCRCISAEYTREAVQPGKSGKIEVIFDGTQAIAGYFNKSIRIRINSSHIYVLKVEGCMK